MKQTVFALDISGSTDGKIEYWNYVDKIFNENKNRVTKYVLWESNANFALLKDVEYRIKNRKGNNGTSPQKIIPFLNDGDDLILVTDGEIDSRDVDNVGCQMVGIKLNSCDSHIISNNPDVSVVCGFTRGIRSSVKTYGKTVTTLTSLTEDDLKIVDRLDNLTLDEFISKYDTIRLVLLNRMIGVSNMDKKLHDSLVHIKAKLHSEFIKNNTGLYDFDTLLKEGRYNDAKILSKVMIDSYYGNSPVKEFSSKFDNLINIVSGKTNFSVNQFNPIKTNTFATAPIVANEDTEILLDFQCNNVMECPIMYNDDVPVIPILHGSPILYGLDKKIIDQVMKNPLSMLGNLEIVEKVKSRLSQSIGISAYCNIYKTTKIHPFSRSEMSGCIPLGSRKEYVNEASIAVMHLFTGGKILGNIDLYFAVLYFIIKDISFLSDTFTFVVDQLKYRMNYHKTSASLSGMVDFVGTRIFFKEAIWFVLTSGNLFTDNAIIPIRQHVFVYNKLIELNGLNNYIISGDDLDYCYKTKRLLSMLQQCKKDPYFKDKIRAIYQDFAIIEGTYIFFDRSRGFYDNQGDEASKKLYDRYKLIYAISTVVDPSKSASSISISSIPNIDDIEFPIISNVWKVEDKYCYLKIHPRTCRPLYNLNDGRIWEDSYKEFYGNCKMLSLNKYFGSFVCEYSKYPTVNEFTLYVWKRETGKGETTIPYNIIELCRLVIDDYLNVMTVISPINFAKRFNESVSRVDRAMLEKEPF